MHEFDHLWKTTQNSKPKPCLQVFKTVLMAEKATFAEIFSFEMANLFKIPVSSNIKNTEAN